MKIKIILFFILCISQSYSLNACEDGSEGRSSSYVLQVEALKMKGEACTDIDVLFRERIPEAPKKFFGGGVVELVDGNEKLVFRSLLGTNEAAKGYYIANFCIADRHIDNSRIVLWINKETRISLNGVGSHSSSGVLCSDTEEVSIKELLKLAGK